MTRQALLQDYQWCSGCHSCESACAMEHGFTDGRCGIAITTIGPWDLGNGQWQYDNVASLTRLCDFCTERAALGKLPACVQHCQAQVLSIGDVAELAAQAATGEKQILMIP